MLLSDHTARVRRGRRSTPSNCCVKTPSRVSVSLWEIPLVGLYIRAVYTDFDSITPKSSRIKRISDVPTIFFVVFHRSHIRRRVWRHSNPRSSPYPSNSPHSTRKKYHSCNTFRLNSSGREKRRKRIGTVWAHVTRKDGRRAMGCGSMGWVLFV